MAGPPTAAAKARGVYRGRKPGTTKAKPARARRLAAKGLTHAEIGAAMDVSRTTVGRYLAAALEVRNIL